MTKIDDRRTSRIIAAFFFWVSLVVLLASFAAMLEGFFTLRSLPAFGLSFAAASIATLALCLAIEAHAACQPLLID